MVEIKHILLSIAFVTTSIFATEQEYAVIGLPSPEDIIRHEIACPEALKEKEKYKRFRQWERDHPALANARNIAIVTGEELKKMGIVYLDTILGPVFDMMNPLTGLELIVSNYLPEGETQEYLADLVGKAKSSSSIIKVAINPTDWKNYVSLLREIPGLTKKDQVKFLANGQVYDKWSEEVEGYLDKNLVMVRSRRYIILDFKITYPTANTTNWSGKVKGKLRLYGYLQLGEWTKELTIDYRHLPFVIKLFIKTNKPYYQGKAVVDSDGKWSLKKTWLTKGTKNTIYAELYDGNNRRIAESKQIEVCVD